jgi:hypothetical protein
MLVKAFGSAVFGIDATTITIETDVVQGIKFLLVGLADSAVRKASNALNRRYGLMAINGPVRKLSSTWPLLISVRKVRHMTCRWLLLYWQHQTNQR